MMVGTNINDLSMQIKLQADRLFPRRDDNSMFLKLVSEVGEFADERGPGEMADIFIMLLDYAARKGWDIETAIRMKMSVNDRRSWTCEDGVYRHVG